MKDPMKSISFVPKIIPGVGWGGVARVSGVGWHGVGRVGWGGG